MPQQLALALQNAHRLLQQRNFPAAAAIVRPLLVQYPGRPEILHLMGLIQRDSGDAAAARQSLSQAVSYGGSAEVRSALGNLLGDLGEVEEADRQFEAAIAQAPNYLPAWINRGRLASRAGKHHAAVEMLERACRIDPSSALAHVSLGNALRAAGEADKAVEVLRRALQLNPSQASTRAHLGLALRAAEKPREAIAEYDAAERADYRQPQLLDNRAAAWLDLGEVDRARRDYDAVTALHPGYLEGHRARARLIWEYALEGDPFESFATLAEAYPGEPSVWLEWINSLMSFRQYEAVVETAEAARRRIGNHPLASLSLAIALSELGRMDEASKAFRAADGALGHDPLFLNAHARHLLKQGEPARAAAAAEASLERDRYNQLAWAYLGTAWRMLGDARESWLHDYERHVIQVAAQPPDSAQTAEAFAEEAAVTLRQLHTARVHPGDQSLRNGTQTPGALFDRRDPTIQRIKQTVKSAVLRFISQLPEDPAHPFLGRKAADIDFSGSWSVRLTQHGFHINHVHVLGWISSAYYFALPDPVPGEERQAGHLQLGAPPDELDLGLPPRRVIEPKVGTLCLFPSSMWHGTIPFGTEGERLTAAFDVVPV